MKLNLETNVKNYMEKNKFSYTDLSRKVKLQITAIKKCCSTNKTRLETVEKIANGLDVTIDQLLFEDIKFN